MSALLAAFINGAILSALLTFLVALTFQISPRAWFNAATKYAVWSMLLVAVAAMPLLYLRAQRATIAALDPASDLPARVLTAASGANAPGTVNSASFKPATRRVWFPLTRSGDQWLQGFLSLWAISAFVMLLRVVVSVRLLSRRKARAFAPPAYLAARLEPWLTRCGTRRRVRLACSDEIATPMAAGPWHPAILIPIRLLNQLKEDEWDQVGLHEAAHMARRDDIVLIVQRILEALFCLHPVVHWISRRMDLEREIACDDFVLAATGRARSYAACLTRVLELGGGMDPSAIAVSAIREGSHLTRRVQALLDQTRNAGTHLLGTRVAGFVVLVVALVWLGWRAPLVIAFAAPQAQTPPVRTLAQAQPRPVPPSPPATPVKPLQRASGPVSMCLVLDTSGSMSSKRIQSNLAAMALTSVSRPDDEICIVSFADDSFLDQPFTRDAQKIQDALSRSETRGGSAVRSAISMTIDYMKSKGTRDKKVLIVVTDGTDTSSVETQDQLLREVKGSGIQIYCVGLLNGVAEEAKRSLRELSAASGGHDYYAEDLTDVQKAAAEIMGLAHNP